MKKKLEAEYAALNEKQRQFDKEKQDFEQHQKAMEDARKNDK